MNVKFKVDGIQEMVYVLNDIGGIDPIRCKYFQRGLHRWLYNQKYKAGYTKLYDQMGTF